ncbi:DCC1-like thiol-disulfide oxidoreductase family protein [Tautonia sp. JC769]|uniref:thiol-disulfide oxidoreductase DCC family protein n=1 Tax=Tautonia sp. JC769 TaxID=3232135 RepID=UPI0034579442
MAACSESRAEVREPIVFYDGECGLCNRFVQFVLDQDAEGRVFLAPLQGETFRERCPEFGRPDLSTVLLLDGGRLYDRSGAAFRVLRRLRWPWPLLGRLGLVIPRPVRDWGYDRVAARRYRWFGPAEACRLPTASERARLLP